MLTKEWMNCSLIRNKDGVNIWKDGSIKKEFSMHCVMSSSANAFKVKHGHSEMYHNLGNKIDKFQNHKALIIGAGESALHIDFSSDDYDSIWSCNKIYLSEKFSNMKLDVHIIGNEVFDTPKAKKVVQKLLEYVNRHNTLCIFEPTYNQKTNYIKTFKEQYSNTGDIYLRYHGHFGTLPRIILYAVFFGCKEIHILGMDGIYPNAKKGHVITHAFEGTKHIKPSYTWDHYKREYIMFWDYVLNFLKLDIKFQNLAEGYPNDMLTYISEIEFPLNERPK